MCGIAGHLNVPPARATQLDAGMAAAIRYRGRDDEGTWRDSTGVATLLHARLRIIDLAGGAQPMTDRTGELCIVFNGEIYNYRELRAEYARLGACFVTESDTEVLLEGYRIKGAAVLDDLIGMFAFALWDARRGELFLARDRLGKKPLYWYAHGDMFLFASTLDAFAGAAGWDGELSRTCLDFYAAVGSLPAGLTAYKRGRALPAGCYAVVRPGHAPRVVRYWRLDFSRKVELSTSDALLAYGELLAHAITIRLRADVPVALTFSGGVDSGTIAALARRESAVPLNCYTLDYDSPDEPSREVAIAREVAAELALPWHFIPFDYRRDLLATLDDALAVVDQPCNHIAISYSQELYRAIAPHATVVLTGNGADELFLGYQGNEALLRQDLEEDAAARQPWWRRFRRAPRRTATLARMQGEYVAGRLGTYADDHSPDELVSDLERDIMATGVSSRADLYTHMALTYYTCDANFRLPDIAGLRAQVEVRSPYLDHRMVEFAASLPTRHKIGDVDDPARNKLLPKQFYATVASPRFAWETKKGMGSNLRYDESFATDDAFRHAYADALLAIRAAGLDDKRFQHAWDAYTADKLRGERYPASAGETIAGFMLGRWLAVRSERGLSSHVARPVRESAA